MHLLEKLLASWVVSALPEVFALHSELKLLQSLLSVKLCVFVFVIQCLKFFDIFANSLLLCLTHLVLGYEFNVA